MANDIIVAHFNEILREVASTAEERLLLKKKIHRSQHKLKCKLINTNPLTDDLFDALTIFFVSVSAVITNVGGYSPQFFFRSLWNSWDATHGFSCAWKWYFINSE